MADRERCPNCGSTNITGRGWDTSDGDEAQERYCYDCKHFEERLRSKGGVSWYGAAPPHRMHAAEGIEAQLLAEIRAAPHDDGPRSIYADWLIERGDPLGTFIALQLARARSRDPVVSDEEQRLLDEHWSAWVGAPSAKLDAKDVAFERGFWSMAAPRNRTAFAALVKHAAPIEEARLLFDVSRDPPELTRLALQRLVIPCLPEFAVRWIERADAAGIGELTLSASLNDAEVRGAIYSARRTGLSRLSFAVHKHVTLCATRDADGSLRVRSFLLGEPQFGDVERWIDQLGEDVDPGVKLEMREVDPVHAQVADRRGLKLVKHVPRCAASPKP